MTLLRVSSWLAALAALTGARGAAAQPARPAKVHVHAFEAARITVNGAYAGDAAADRALDLEVPPGVLTIGASFAGGGAGSYDVLAGASREYRVRFSEHEDRAIAARRVGRFRFGAGVSFHAGRNGDFSKLDLGPAVYGVISRGIGKALDLQLLVGAGLVFYPEVAGPGVQANLEPRALFHFGTVFTMSAGINLALGSQGGADLYAGEPQSWGGGLSTGSIEYRHAAPARSAELRVSPVGLQFGAGRGHHIELFHYAGVEAVERVDTNRSPQGALLRMYVSKESYLTPRLGIGLRYTVLFTAL